MKRQRDDAGKRWVPKRRLADAVTGCTAEAPCADCRKVEQLARDHGELPTRTTYALLDAFAACPQVDAAYRRGLESEPEPEPPLQQQEQQPQQQPAISPIYRAAGQFVLKVVPKHSDPGPTTAAAAPVPSVRTVSDALCTPVTPERIAALQARYTPNTNALHVHVLDKDVMADFDDATDKHDYIYKGVLVSRSKGQLTASGINKEVWVGFNPKEVSGFLAKKAQPDNPAAAAEVAAAYQDEWNQTKKSGTKKHAGMDAVLQGRAFDPAKMEVPAGFVRNFEALADEYDIWRTEWTIASERYQIFGQIDYVLVNRKTGKLRLGDHKNCKDVDLDAWGSKRYGIHPATCDMKDTKLAHYKIQTSVYWWILKHEYGMDMEDEIQIDNYVPTEPDSWYCYTFAPLDLTFLLSFFPWRDDDPRHTYFPGPTLVQRFADDDARALKGPTTRIRAPPGVPPPDDVVWTGALYPSAKARAAAAAKGEPLRYDLAESVWKHPWSWFGPPPRGAYGYYERYLLSNEALLKLLPSIVGKRVACWCQKPEERCHADVIVKYANLYKNKAWTEDDYF